jgi:hypothetical protein
VFGLLPAVLPKLKPTAHSEDIQEPREGGGGSVAFRLLSRDTKGRVEARQLLVPDANPMAIKLAQAELTLKAEKQRLKQRILMIESMSADMEVSVIEIYENIV